MSEWYETRKYKNKKPEKIVRLSKDRRILYNVPDSEHIRSGADRRGSDEGKYLKTKQAQDTALPKKGGIRYLSDFEVTLTACLGGKKKVMKAQSVDISATGILVAVKEMPDAWEKQERCVLLFDIPAGTMSEGFESRVETQARLVRSFTKENDQSGDKHLAFEFKNNLFEYFQKKRWGYSVSMASAFLFVAVLIVMLMRVESFFYFKYNWFLYLYSFIAAVFLISRYLFGALYRNVPINPDFTPGVSIIIPCFNEEEWIDRTILSCMNQDYPLEKLEVIVVDDCSTDSSFQRIQEAQAMLLKEAERFKIGNRLRVTSLQQNSGKRVALARGVEMARHELVVFVDSDSFLDGMAIRNLVQPFQDPKMGGVTGRTDVENKYTNALTKLQTVRYYIAFRVMKAAESYFDSVTCLSGPLSCYRKDLVEKYKQKWLDQKFLGRPATFGDDRSLTNYIIKHYRATYQDNAVCSTVVPSEGKQFLNQQMRWKRSWLRETLRAAGFIWRKEPFMALFFYVGFIVPIAAPVVFGYNLLYVPITEGIFPSTFLIGLLLMAMLLSLSHLIFQKSKIWLYGFVFCIFYELVLLWQMPVAWFTFAKSTWGTRDTPEDILEKARKQQAKMHKQKARRHRAAVADERFVSHSTGMNQTAGRMQSNRPMNARKMQYGTRKQRTGKKR